MAERALKIYFAGDLFDAKDLAGNLLLAEALEKASQGRYQVMLPQESESEVKCRTSQSIRDTDFELLFTCDVIVANFDGPDLDSGTVVEFCFAKMVDMPALLLRTDFRNGGDVELPDNQPWNLMCSHYPRTGTAVINAMVCYHEQKMKSSDSKTLLDNFYREIASKITVELDKVTAEKSWLPAGELLNQYKRAVKSVGGTLESRLSGEVLEKLVSSKLATGLFSEDGCNRS